MGRQQITTDQQIRLLQIELAKAKQENTRLRKSLGENSRHARCIQKAYEDALLLLFWWSVGIKPSRRFAAQYQITQYRWESAVGLLRMARLIQGRSRWEKIDLAKAEEKLARAKQKALEDPPLFFLRLNVHHQR